MPDMLSSLDDLIDSLESAVDEVVDYDFVVSPGQPPKSATYTILSSVYGEGLQTNKRFSSEVYGMSEGVMLMRSRENILKNTELEVYILVNKTSLGETIHIASVKAMKTQRVSGAYQVKAEITGVKKLEVPAQNRLMEFIANDDAVGWNRWCADLEEGPKLAEMDLTHCNLKYFDLCCADLAGSILIDSDLSHANLSGANLEMCVLDGVKVIGADFFRARVPSKYKGLIATSGTIEAESVIFTD